MDDGLHLQEREIARRREHLLERRPVLHLGVAIDARHRRVLPAQGEVGLLVVEGAVAPGKGERLFAVTALAILAELAAVLVEVTAVAAFGEPEVGGAPRLGGQHPDDVVVDQLSFGVAALAGGLGVVAAQRPAGLLVIEAFEGTAEVDEPEVAPPMVGMATLTLLENRGGHVPVKPRQLLDLGTELRVASEATLGEAGLPLVVARAALVEPLSVEGGVRLGQRAGREELGPGGERRAREQNEDERHRPAETGAPRVHALAAHPLTTRSI
jgi:hypothetical protein